MDLMQFVKDWVWIASALAPLMFGWAMLYLRERFPTKDEHNRQADGMKAAVEELSKQVDRRHHDADARLTRLELTTQHLPSRQDLEEIYRRLGKVEQTTAVTNEAIAGLGRLLGKVDHTATLLLNRELKETGK